MSSDLQINETLSDKIKNITPLFKIFEIIGPWKVAGEPFLRWNNDVPNEIFISSINYAYYCFNLYSGEFKTIPETELSDILKIINAITW